MKISLTAARNLLTALGMKQAKEWDAAKAAQRAEKVFSELDVYTDADTMAGIKDKAVFDLIKQLKKLRKEKGKLEVGDDDAPAAPKAVKKQVAKAVAGKGKPDDEEDEEEESDSEADEEEEESEDEDSEDDEESSVEEEEDEDEKPRKKKDPKTGAPPAKKDAPRKAGAPGQPGVIASIIEFLAKASDKKPLTKKMIGEKLAKRFPEKDIAGMMKTVNVQVPNRIKVEKDLNVEKNESGYWIGSIPAKHPIREQLKLDD